MHFWIIAAGQYMVPSPARAHDAVAAAPTQQQYVEALSQLHPISAVVLVGFGLLCLLIGWKLFKYVVVANAAIMGGYGGYQLGTLLANASPSMPLFCSIAGALLLAFAAWPLMKGAVGLMGALAGGALGYGTWHYVAYAVGRADLSQYAWAGAIIGAVMLGMLAFPAFRIVVMTFTSFQGAAIALTGVLSLLVKHEAMRGHIRHALDNNIYLLPLLILLPTLMGFLIQYTASSKKKPAS